MAPHLRPRTGISSSSGWAGWPRGMTGAGWKPKPDAGTPGAHGTRKKTPIVGPWSIPTAFPSGRPFHSTRRPRFGRAYRHGRKGVRFRQGTSSAARSRRSTPTPQLVLVGSRFISGAMMSARRSQQDQRHSGRGCRRRAPLRNNQGWRWRQPGPSNYQGLPHGRAGGAGKEHGMRLVEEPRMTTWPALGADAGGGQPEASRATAKRGARAARPRYGPSEIRATGSRPPSPGADRCAPAPRRPQHRQLNSPAERGRSPRRALGRAAADAARHRRAGQRELVATRVKVQHVRHHGAR